MNYKYVFLNYSISILFILLNITLAYPQQEDKNVKTYPKDHILANFDSLKIAKVSIGAFKLTPYLAPSYTPETKVLFSIGGLVTYSVQKNNKRLERSTLYFAIGHSTNQSTLGNIKSTIYGKNDNIRFYTDMWIKNMPDNYWGVGYANGRYLDQSDSTTAYHRHWLKLQHKTSFRINEKIFLGFIVDISGTTATVLNPRMQNDPYIVNQGTRIRNTGIGGLFQYDTRDFIQNAYKGTLLEGSYTIYDNFLGGKTKFQIIDIDFRKYFTLTRERQTLAIQSKSRIGIGDVPWPELSQLGTPFDLRGYIWGRYRDRDYLLGLAEYRHMFMRFNPSKSGSMNSRFGYVIWGGLGSVAVNIGSFNNWLPNYGVGLRFEAQPRMNLRIDYGFGNDSKAVYITFAETF